MLPHVDIERIRAMVAHEYEVSSPRPSRGGRADRRLVPEDPQQLVQRWEEASFRSETRALLAELRLQHRRLELLDAQLA